MAKKATSKKVVRRKKAGPAGAAAKEADRKAQKASRRSGGAAKGGKPKPPLTKAQLNRFRQMLLEKRRSIMGDMNGIEAEALGAGQDGSRDLSNMPTHPADIGTDNFEHEFTLGLLQSERALITEIDGALERINTGTYGICEGTRQPIGVPRLTARPWARYCIDYARKLEKGLIRPGQVLTAPDEDEDED